MSASPWCWGGGVSSVPVPGGVRVPSPAAAVRCDARAAAAPASCQESARCGGAGLGRSWEKAGAPVHSKLVCTGFSS